MNEAALDPNALPLFENSPLNESKPQSPSISKDWERYKDPG